jgi:hypothetical protein
VLTSAVTDNGTTTVIGTLNSLANRSFRIEIYASSYDTSQFRAGEWSLGTIDVTTNGNGDASFTFISPEVVPAGQRVIALATWLAITTTIQRRRLNPLKPPNSQRVLSCRV